MSSQDQKKYLSKLDNSRVLIIGGTSGIGYCIAEACLEHNAIVTISSSNPSRVKNAVEMLQASYPSSKGRVFGVKVDLSERETLEDELKNMLDECVGSMEGGKLDHVVYTAGDALSTMKLKDMTLPKILQAGQIRFFAPLLLAKFLPDYLSKSYKSSYTVTTGSISEKPIPDWTVVASYAGGHHSMVRNLALDMKPIRVNGVSPGVVDTPLWRQEPEEKARLMKEMEEKMMTGRVPLAEDVAESFLVVLKDCNMTGSMISTNGGALFK